MEKTVHPKQKLISKENSEKPNSFRSKLRETFSKTMVRSISIPRSRGKDKKTHEENSKKRHSRNKSTNSATHNSTRFSTPDNDRIRKSVQSERSNGMIQQSITTQSTDCNNNFHYFIQRPLKDKSKRCDVCKESVIQNGGAFACKYCLMVSHDKCCENISMKCNNNQLSVLNDLLYSNKVNNDGDRNIKILKPASSPEVILRNKLSSTDISPSSSEYYTCKTSFIDTLEKSRASYNFYHDAADTPLSRDSLLSLSSMSSSISFQFYDFTTLDRNSIEAYGIEVNPISQTYNQSFDNKSNDEIFSNDSTPNFSNINNYHCKPSFIYNEISQEIVKIDWKIDDLTAKSNLFNENNFGLCSEMKTCKSEIYLLGTVRVYINLLRPIQMEFPVRPSSIYDIIPSKENTDNININAKIETIWLPRGSSKRLYVNQSTSTIEVINCLLKKFRIKANPKKFGLYEHTIEGERRVSVRKLVNIECPMAMLLSWSEEGKDQLNAIMSIKRLVLQENETGDIEWSEFSKPELRNFLLILSREEEEISKEIHLKYSILKKEIIRLQSLVIKRTNFITVF